MIGPPPSPMPHQTQLPVSTPLCISLSAHHFSVLLSFLLFSFARALQPTLPSPFSLFSSVTPLPHPLHPSISSPYCFCTFLPPSLPSRSSPHHLFFFCPLLLASFSPSGSSVQSVPLLPPPLLLLTSLSVCIAIVLQRLCWRWRRQLFTTF